MFQEQELYPQVEIVVWKLQMEVESLIRGTMKDIAEMKGGYYTEWKKKLYTISNVVTSRTSAVSIINKDNASQIGKSWKVKLKKGRDKGSMILNMMIMLSQMTKTTFLPWNSFRFTSYFPLFSSSIFLLQTLNPPSLESQVGIRNREDFGFVLPLSRDYASGPWEASMIGRVTPSETSKVIMELWLVSRCFWNVWEPHSSIVAW